ncbi:MAG: hypothetical protein QW734_01075 [Candidatus Bathyarchaeia archaeon]
MLSKIVSQLIIKSLSKEKLTNLVLTAAEVVGDIALEKVKSKVSGKFMHLCTVFGRVYALAFTSDFVPPVGHPNAVHVDVVLGAIHVWLVSFPKKGWQNLPDYLKLKVKL